LATIAIASIFALHDSSFCRYQVVSAISAGSLSGLVQAEVGGWVQSLITCHI
jgi:hypothetical protein